jgi:GntR family transcriptional regulator
MDRLDLEGTGTTNVKKLSAVAIARNSGVHAYCQIETCIREAMEKGSLAPGDELPSEHEMAEAFKVNRLTARRAVQEQA